MDDQPAVVLEAIAVFAEGMAYASMVLELLTQMLTMLRPAFRETRGR
jgi:hypothetical protein